MRVGLPDADIDRDPRGNYFWQGSSPGPQSCRLLLQYVLNPLRNLSFHHRVLGIIPLPNQPV
jgi:hypothetical protein